MPDANHNNKSTTIFCGGLSFSWLIVWASFTTAPLVGKRFALLDAFLAFTVAATVIGWARNRRWRNYHFVALHLIGLTCFVLHTLHASFYSTTAFFSTIWLAALGDRLQNVQGFLTAFLVAAWTAVFWSAGTQLGRRHLSYLLVCNRFDAGLTALFALLLVQLVLVVRGGLSITAPPDAFYMCTFFLCGLPAIGLARYRGRAEKQFLPGIRGVAILATFTVAILTAAGLLVVLAPPILAPVAEDGYVMLQTAARPLGHIITRILIFIFKRDHDYSVSPEGFSGGSGDLLPDETNAWGIWLARLMAEGLIIFLFLVLLIFVGYLIWRLVRWLLQRDSGPRQVSPPWVPIAEFFLRLLAWLQYGYRAVLLHLGGPRNIGGLFAALQIWGRLAGVSRQNWETPQEFAVRLSKRFPRTAEEIHTIVCAFQNQIYGEMNLDSSAISSAYAAWRRLRSPVLWPSRWRSLFGRPQAP